MGIPVRQRGLSGRSVAALLAAAILSALGLASQPSLARDGALLSEGQARDKAVEILLGEPYGRTPGEVRRNITSTRFVGPKDKPNCGRPGKAGWEFRVSTTHEGRPLSGYLRVDARTGELDCASLPFLD